jgi:ParB family chromosome partitioning protein
VRERDDAIALELALIENMAREDLSPVEEARACAALVEELDLRHEDVARRVGRSRAAVSNLIRLLDLPDEAIQLLEGGTLSEGHGRALLGAEGHDARRRLAREAAAQGWSVRVTEQRARDSNGTATPRQRRRITARAHPDAEQGAQEIAATLERALGAEVRVRATSGGYTAELSFASPAEALELARRLGSVPAG